MTERKVTEGIITANDIAKRDRRKSWGECVIRLSVKMQNENKLDVPFKPGLKGEPVEAFLDYQRWLASCDVCGGSEYVDPYDPFFYCISCGNRENGGHPRPVKFPLEETRLKIERLIMERPVRVRGGTEHISRAMQSRLAFVEGKPYPRSWRPGISLTELRKDDKNMKKGIEKGKVKYGSL